MGKIMLKAYKYRLYINGSNNRYKARLKVAKLHEKITNQRKNFLHKLSTKLIRENQSIAIEDLRVKNMLKNNKLSKVRYT